ncbi:MAG: peroxiredoxin [Alphaproteobacteria bacterium]|nr:peroxiredoxin [Alphaproteobacteria bacterium]
MAVKIGDNIPAARLMYMSDKGPASITTGELFARKRVAVFGLPGAYTPVCSAQHLPGFVAKAGAFKGKKIDRIVCVSVNDPFVMDAWGKDHKVGGDIMMLADDKGELTRALGLQEDFSDFGLGERSRRYSMIVDNGRVTALNIEDSVFACGISSAESLVAQA